jgi:hypothetical protein
MGNHGMMDVGSRLCDWASVFDKNQENKRDNFDPYCHIPFGKWLLYQAIWFMEETMDHGGYPSHFSF